MPSRTRELRVIVALPSMRRVLVFACSRTGMSHETHSHRAAADCRAMISRLKEMAGWPVDWVGIIVRKLTVSPGASSATRPPCHRVPDPPGAGHDISQRTRPLAGRDVQASGTHSHSPCVLLGGQDRHRATGDEPREILSRWVPRVPVVRDGLLDDPSSHWCSRFGVAGAFGGTVPPVAVSAGPRPPTFTPRVRVRRVRRLRRLPDRAIFTAGDGFASDEREFGPTVRPAAGGYSRSPEPSAHPEEGGQ